MIAITPLIDEEFSNKNPASPKNVAIPVVIERIINAFRLLTFVAIERCGSTKNNTIPVIIPRVIRIKNWYPILDNI